MNECPSSLLSGKYSRTSQKSSKRSDSHVSTTTRPVVTRRTSARPVAASVQWWTVWIAMAASNVSSGNGRDSATPTTAGPAPGRRCRSMVGEGSTAMNLRLSLS